MDNQTDPADLANVTAATQGTGIFLIPDVTSDEFGAAAKVLQENITYPDCIRRGQFAVAFKWVPDAVESYSKLQLAKCTGPCVKTCVRKGCVCNVRQGQCQ